MSVVAHTTVLPGDAINLEEYGIKRKKLIVGPGLIKQEEDGEEVIKACKAGVLKHKVESGSTIWTDNPQKRVSFIFSHHIFLAKNRRRIVISVVNRMVKHVSYECN